MEADEVFVFLGSKIYFVVCPRREGSSVFREQEKEKEHLSSGENS